MALSAPIRREEGSLQGVGDVVLYHQRWLSETAPRGAVIVLHGIGNHGGRYADLAEALASSGYAVHALDQRGHGRSQGPRAYVERFADLIDDVDAFVELVGARAAGEPLFLFGHSWGGLLALSYAVRHQDRLDGLVLCVAGIAPAASSPEQIEIVRRLAHDAPGTPVVQLPVEKLTRNPQALHDFRTDPLVHRDGIPARLAAETLNAIEDLSGRLGAITLPLLITHGTDDEISDPAGSRRIYDEVRSPDRTLKLYDGLWHQPFNDPERDTVIADLVQWLDTHS
jgi:acylglycerol lipase